MGVKSVQLSTTGLIPNTTGLGKALAQQLPVPIFIETNDLLETVLVTGYLNKSRADFQFVYSNQQMALVYTTDQGPVWLAVVISGTNYSLQGTVDVSTVYRASVGSAALPSYTFVGDLDTGMYRSAANSIGFSANGAAVALISTTGLSVTGTLTATGNILSSAGSLTSGKVSGGTAGGLNLFAATTASGALAMLAVDNASGDFDTTISNAAAIGQDQVISIPDSGAATANFLLSAGTATMAAGSSIILAKGTSTEAANAVTVSANAGVITTSALTTAAAGTYAITFTNTFIAADSVVHVTLMGGTNTTPGVSVSATADAGTSIITITNNDAAAAALNGTLILGFSVF